MPTAQEQGFIEGNNFPTKLQAGDSIEVTGLPRFEVAKELDNAPVAVIPTEDGERSTTSKTIIGQLKSDNAKSAGGLIAQAIKANSTLTLFVVERKANTGRMGLALSPFK